MLKPLHFCFWFHQRCTQLRYKDERFHSGGTSLSIVWDVLKRENWHWLSREYGEVYTGQAENLILVVPSDAVSTPQGWGPLTARLGDSTVCESFLSDALCTTLGVGSEGDYFTVLPENRIRCAVHLHDDCFASVQPVDRALLVRLVHATLKLHSYYQNQDIDWLPVLEPLTQLLVTVGEHDVSTSLTVQTAPL